MNTHTEGGAYIIQRAVDAPQLDFYLVPVEHTSVEGLIGSPSIDDDLA